MYHTPEVRGFVYDHVCNSGWAAVVLVGSWSRWRRMGDVTTRRAPFSSLKFPDGQFKRGASLETHGGRFPLVAYGTGQHQRPFLPNGDHPRGITFRHMANTLPKQGQKTPKDVPKAAKQHHISTTYEARNGQLPSLFSLLLLLSTLPFLLPSFLFFYYKFSPP